MELNKDSLFRYQRGLMTIDERLDFEDLLDANPEFKNNLIVGINPVFENIDKNIKILNKLSPERSSSVVLSFREWISNSFFTFINILKRTITFTLPTLSKVPSYGKYSFIMASLVIFFVLGWYGTKIYYRSVNNQLADKGISVYTPKILENHAGANDMSDTLCNCGKEEFIYNFRGEVKPKTKFTNQLNLFLPKNGYQTQCKNYFEGWLAIEADQYDKSIPYFEAVWKSNTISPIRHEAGHGLIISYLYNNERDKAIEIAKALQKEEDLNVVTRNFINEILK